MGDIRPQTEAPSAQRRLGDHSQITNAEQYRPRKTSDCMKVGIASYVNATFAWIKIEYFCRIRAGHGDEFARIQDSWDLEKTGMDGNGIQADESGTRSTYGNRFDTYGGFRGSEAEGT
ncbi:hypothetical protein X801_07197 [Opisthorchis viverrini]|uniref:Uncharacterized protein n=1 Tax=Opisthorchis viverrini TaxID=6198 RepID=A0A1S8WRS3_OPIVI|nr:hypothetical protein X801_07197 [Opisthorchis viverrini]